MDETLKRKLLRQLTPEEADLLHWLADECGIRSDDPLFSLLIAMHHYQTLLQLVPQELAGAVDTALNKTLAVSGTMQSQLEAAQARHLQQLVAERQHWQQQLIPIAQQLSTAQASSQQLKQALDQTAQAQTALQKTVKQAQRQWAASPTQAEQNQQQWLMVISQGMIALIMSLGWLWVGAYGLSGKLQTQPLSQTTESPAQFWQWNRERIALCQKDNNPKCTLWITTPPSAKQP